LLRKFNHVLLEEKFMLRDPKDPFELTRSKVFAYGLVVCVFLTALVWIYVPKAPTNSAQSVPLEGPGSQSALLAGPESLTGEQGYTKFCAQCHGATGQADTQIAKMMGGKVPSLVSGTFSVPRNVDSIVALILKGSENGSMPGFSKELGSEGARRVSEFVLKLPQQKSSDK
jgi:cytochrome c